MLPKVFTPCVHVPFYLDTFLKLCCKSPYTCNDRYTHFLVWCRFNHYSIWPLVCSDAFLGQPKEPSIPWRLRIHATTGAFTKTIISFEEDFEIYIRFSKYNLHNDQTLKVLIIFIDFVGNKFCSLI